VKRSIQAFAFAIILVGLTATRARADVAITVDNGTVAPGGTGTVDITVTSNMSDTLSSFGLELLITLQPGTTSLLQFTLTQPDPFGNPNYVFYGASSKSDLAIPFWGPPFQSSPITGYPNDSITGGDSDDGSGLGYVTIGSSVGQPNTFLASVQFQAAPGATPGDQFQISLVNDPNFTYFDDQNGNPLTYTSTPGTVLVASEVSAVPEPSSLTVVALSGLSGLLWCYRRNRTHGPSTDSPLAASFQAP
jgi:hypothetical protein